MESIDVILITIVIVVAVYTLSYIIATVGRRVYLTLLTGKVHKEVLKDPEFKRMLADSFCREILGRDRLHAEKVHETGKTYH